MLNSSDKRYLEYMVNTGGNATIKARIFLHKQINKTKRQEI